LCYRSAGFPTLLILANNQTRRRPSITIPLKRPTRKNGLGPAPRLDRGEDPGRQVIVTPGKIDIPPATRQAPQSAYGVTVTVPRDDYTAEVRACYGNHQR
jgi:hypothetical protein